MPEDRQPENGIAFERGIDLPVRKEEQQDQGCSEELRAQLARYAEALEEDLQAGREKVANRSREGLRFEKMFLDASSLLVGHLRGKPECRELMAELNSPSTPSSQAASSMTAASAAAAAPPVVSRTA
ncbi:MAG TPA: hypothetical protein VIV60_29100 [Polyangiaceae bacterium]